MQTRAILQETRFEHALLYPRMKVNCKKISRCTFCGLLARQAHEGDNYLSHFTLPSPIHRRASSARATKTERWARDRPAPGRRPAPIEWSRGDVSLGMGAVPA